eukprot:CAMPEP_0171460898 /NCGR_PEP_ID=MMETSP0945-20130129/5581_1 /TAXON_ID=109269 /ORGANISM="Vaucheria litorea, Strain CCMP2940" /LENGTH=56 /DNA_ID=CAMNT_0011987175 /DNA_START=917 /DNA_END=1087 /DNA_ORIENTATION=+
MQVVRLVGYLVQVERTAAQKAAERAEAKAVIQGQVALQLAAPAVLKDLASTISFLV